MQPLEVSRLFDPLFHFGFAFPFGHVVDNPPDFLNIKEDVVLVGRMPQKLAFTKRDRLCPSIDQRHHLSTIFAHPYLVSILDPFSMYLSLE